MKGMGNEGEGLQRRGMEVLKGNWGNGGRFKGNGEERIRGNEERKR
jgi:hypothetical protein